MVKSYLSRSLLETIPTFLYRRLLRFGIRVGLWRNLPRTNPSSSVRVYDLLNAGPRHRFSIVGKTPFVVSNCVQAAGHDCFMWLTKIVAKQLGAARIDYRPYIWDIHDCVMLTVPEEQAARAKEILDGPVLQELNQLMNGPVTFKAECNIVNNFWEDKAE